MIDCNIVAHHIIIIGLENMTEEIKPRKRRTKKNYINNPDFYDALLVYRDACTLAKSKGEEKPPLPRYLGECFFILATRIATKGNFSSYSYKEDMILDGVERCITYVSSFNPDVTQNPFAYFTRTVYNAFINRIKNERKDVYFKYKMMIEHAHFGMLHDGDGSQAYSKTNLEYAEEYIKNYDELEVKRIEAKRLRKEAADLAANLDTDSTAEGSHEAATENELIA